MMKNETAWVSWGDAGDVQMTAEVVNHWLDWASPEVSLTKKTDRVSSVIVPELIVVHYAVTHNLDATTAAQRARGYWAQLSIDGYASNGPDYQIYQSMPFNMRGSHAGESSWTHPKTGSVKDECNAFSIGIEIANPGPLVERNGKLYTVYGKEWDSDDAIEVRHRNPTPKEWTHWARYSDQEIDILIAIGHALRRAYPTIIDMRGHDEISPGRKSDPGPAMDMDYLRSKVFG